jgi:ABC-type lipoprotein export system ATPase subunit
VRHLSGRLSGGKQQRVMIATSLLVFERLHWPEVMAELTKKAANT